MLGYTERGLRLTAPSPTHRSSLISLIPRPWCSCNTRVWTDTANLARPIFHQTNHPSLSLKIPSVSSKGNLTPTFLPCLSVALQHLVFFTWAYSKEISNDVHLLKQTTTTTTTKGNFIPKSSLQLYKDQVKRRGQTMPHFDCTAQCVGLKYGCKLDFKFKP